jgi:hypothetical protein
VTLDDLIRGARADFLFHYTDAISADDIVEWGCFETGPGAYGPGLYATDIAPEGPDTIEDVINKCFYGNAIPAEVNNAIAVLRESPHGVFKPASDSYHWVLDTPILGLVQLDRLYVARVVFDGRVWEVQS